ncbi:GNAT family N-acetyltransferase [Streptomyces sp. NPDC054765]
MCDRTGWDAALLSWNICSPCRHGHIAKISVADHWQRQGLGRRMVQRAMHGAKDYRWSTTHHSPLTTHHSPVAPGATILPRPRP